MRAYQGSTLMQGILALAVSMVVLTWFAAVPAVLTPANFLGLVAVFAAFGWIARITYVNGQPAASLAQSPHGAERRRSLERPGRSR